MSETHTALPRDKSLVMGWTSAVPTVAGYYWFKARAAGPRVVEVREWCTKPGWFSVESTDGVSQDLGELVRSWNGTTLWSGPIPEPKE